MAISRRAISNNQQTFISKPIFSKFKLIYSALIKSVSMVCLSVYQKNISDKNRMKARNNSGFRMEYGFTLTELIVTILILAIIVAIAAPSILTQLAGMEAKRIRYSIMNTLAIAKAESYIQHQNVLACLSDTKGRCDRDSSKTLLLFMDKNDNKVFDASVDELLEKQRLNPKYGTLHLRAGNRDYIRFAGNSGKPRGFFGHIKYCPSTIYNQAMYQISFNQSGIIKYKPNRIHDTGC